MKTQDKRKKRFSAKQIESIVERNLARRAKYYFDYLGTVNYSTNERILFGIREAENENPNAEIILTVTSPGGPTGIGMHFHDHIKSVLRPNLTTIGSGDVDSSGILILLSGSKRYATRHTTALLHLAGRKFSPDTRFTVLEMEAMLKEDKLKNEQYAEVVALNSNGKLSKKEVLNMMEINTVLSAQDLLNYGLVEKVLD